jgi:hypothetical protein
MKTATIPTLIAIVSFSSLAVAQEAALAPQVSPVQPSSSDVGVDNQASSSSSDGSVLTHEGFMLRMSGGLAMLGAGIEPEQNVEVGAGGIGQTLSLSLGGYIVPNLALHADLLGASAEHGVTNVGAEDDGSTVHTERFAMGGVGLGLTYYVMPYNLSLTGSLLLAQMSIQPEEGPSFETDYVVLGKLGIAKQWAVSEYWGLGLGASALFGAGQGDDSEGEDFDTGVGGFSVDLVATYD